MASRAIFLFHRKAFVRLKWKSKDLLDRHADQRYDKTVINHGKDMAAMCLIYQLLNAKINTDKMFLLNLKIDSILIRKCKNSVGMTSFSQDAEKRELACQIH